MAEVFDSEVLNKIRNGEQLAINQIYKPLKVMASNIFRHYGIKNYDLAHEIVKDVITEVVLSKKKFTEPFNVMGYLYHITKSLICRHLRDSIPMVGQEMDSENLKEICPQIDSDIAMYEANDAIDVCLGFLNDREILLIEKIRSGESADNLTREFGYKNKEVFRVRKSIVIAKFRSLLRKNGVDF
jgi:DNA-directed RNA polymerase specialized sigma24 family protein